MNMQAGRNMRSRPERRGKAFRTNGAVPIAAPLRKTSEWWTADIMVTFETLQAYLEAERQRVLSACTQCGRCFEACAMVPYGESLQEAEPKPMVGGVLSLLAGEKGTEEALAWVNICNRSGDCVSACPESVNPQMMMRIAKMYALGGFGREKQLLGRDDPNLFPRIWAFARLQFTDDELKEWA